MTEKLFFETNDMVMSFILFLIYVAYTTYKIDNYD